IKKALVDLSNRPAIPKQISLYTIEDVISVRPGVSLFHAVMEGGEPRLLMVYNLGRDPLESQELYDLYMREFKTLKELRATNLVAEVSDPFKWSEDFLVLPIIPLTGKPLSDYPRPETREELAQELLLALACFKGLEVIHSKKILHRAIGPDTVYVLQSGQAPKIAFTNFFAARLGAATIAGTLDRLALAAEDPYAAVDLTLSYEYAQPETDVFSLGLVFLERLAGVSIIALRASSESDVVFPDLKERWSILPTDAAVELSRLFQEIAAPERYAPPPPVKEIIERLTGLIQSLRTGLRDQEELTLSNGRFKVERVLGQGSMAKTYLASYADYADAGLGSFVLKQFLRPDEVYEQATAEYQALQQIKSRYFPTINDIFPKQDEVHVKMEYIPGPTLKELATSFPWPVDRWWAFAQDLLNALEILEKKGLLHRDIKPENIILCEGEEHPVLIDFGFAVWRDRAGGAGMAGTPLYLPPEIVTAQSSPPTSDRYAAGVVLYRILTGALPFMLVGGQRELARPGDIADPKVRRIATVLLRVVSNTPTERPLNVDQVRQELQAAILAIEDVPETSALAEMINPWVDDIRGLYRNSESGNANNRGLDTQFVRDTYVQTALDERLLPAILANRPKAVFLSGNPGDGKTAFLEQVKQALVDRKGTFIRQDSSGWECRYEGHIFRSCYDASEAYQGLSADEQLAQKLRGLEGASIPDAALTVLIAINDGRLMDYFERHKEQFHWLADQVERSHDESEIEHLPVWKVDLKRRAFVLLPEAEEVSIFTKVLRSLVAEQHWRVCEECAAQAVCPIRNNAAALRKRSISKWLEYLLLLAHLRRQRHITMRDLRSAIAYLITGNASCQQVHEARHGEEAGASLIDLSYWRSAFAPLEISDELLKDLLTLDPARFAHPQLDRFLHFHQAPEEAEARRLLYSDRADLSRQRFIEEREWIAATKRRLYFEVSKPAKDAKDAAQAVPSVRRLQLLPYRYAKEFITLLDDRFDDEAMAWIRERLALGILRSDGIVEDVPPGQLSVQVSASVEQQLVVLKQFPIEAFDVYAEPLHDTQLVEQIPECIIFEHISGTPRLEITLDLFELLMRMADGLVPDAQEYQPLLEDLRRFKDTLLLQETRELILIESQRRVHHIKQREGKIVRVEA
ncbi:MAG: protein kinase, partial [Ktedonobacteraceae bacterium]